jgi:hypothetical protein
VRLLGRVRPTVTDIRKTQDKKLESDTQISQKG